MGFLEALEELSKEQRRLVGDVSRKYGLDGYPVGNFSDLVPKRKKKKGGRPKGKKNLTMKEKLERRQRESLD